MGKSLLRLVSSMFLNTKWMCQFASKQQTHSCLLGCVWLGCDLDKISVVRTDCIYPLLTGSARGGRRLEGKQGRKPVFTWASVFASWVYELHRSSGSSPRSKQFIPVLWSPASPESTPLSVPEMAACPTLPAHGAPPLNLVLITPTYLLVQVLSFQIFKI